MGQLLPHDFFLRKEEHLSGKKKIFPPKKTENRKTGRTGKKTEKSVEKSFFQFFALISNIWPKNFSYSAMLVQLGQSDVLRGVVGVHLDKVGCLLFCVPNRHQAFVQLLLNRRDFGGQLPQCNGALRATLRGNARLLEAGSDDGWLDFLEHGLEYTWKVVASQRCVDWLGLLPFPDRCLICPLDSGHYGNIGRLQDVGCIWQQTIKHDRVTFAELAGVQTDVGAVPIDNEEDGQLDLPAHYLGVELFEVRQECLSGHPAVLGPEVACRWVQVLVDEFRVHWAGCSGGLHNDKRLKHGSVVGNCQVDGHRLLSANLLFSNVFGPTPSQNLLNPPAVSVKPGNTKYK